MANVTENFKQKFKSNLELGLQQKSSKLRKSVQMDELAGEVGYFDRIGLATAREKTTRNTDIVYDNPEHIRRACKFRSFFWSTLVDSQDKLRLMLDPASEYSKNAVMALGRKMDTLIINAALGTAYSGKSGTTAISLPSSSVVAKNFVETGFATDSNLTLGKLRKAVEMLNISEILDDGENGTCVISANQLTALLRDTNVTSSDYNSVKALVNGEISTFLGLDFIRTQLLPKTGDDRTVLVYGKRSIKLGMAKDIVTKADVIPTKHYSTQVYAAFDADASRMFEDGVVSVLCDETK